MSADSDISKSVGLGMTAASLVRFVVQYWYHQPILPLKSFRSKHFYTVMKNFSTAEISVKLAINRNSFRFILYLHVYSSSQQAADTMVYPRVCVCPVRLIDSRHFDNVSDYDTRYFGCLWPRWFLLLSSAEEFVCKESHLCIKQVSS